MPRADHVGASGIVTIDFTAPTIVRTELCASRIVMSLSNTDERRTQMCSRTRRTTVAASIRHRTQCIGKTIRS